MVGNTEMHILTAWISIFQAVMFLYQAIYYWERPDDKQRGYYLLLLFLLLCYNVTGGLFPDPNIGINVVLQNILAYGSAIAMSSYFAIYIYKAFDLRYLRWFAYYGIFLFVVLPFAVAFIVPYVVTGDLDYARKFFVWVPAIYCIVFLFAVSRAFYKEYKLTQPDSSLQAVSRRERIVSVGLALLFWITLPVITYYDMGQVWEVSMTNAGFLVMTITFLRTSVRAKKDEYRRLRESEERLLHINEELNNRVTEATRELASLNVQKTNNFINLAHETKTPLTLLQHYLDRYIKKAGPHHDLSVMQDSVEKLVRDVSNFFDIERFSRGMDIYDHNQLCNLSDLVESSVQLFTVMAESKSQQVENTIEKNILLRAAPEALQRIINNLLENAYRYTGRNGVIIISLENSKNGLSKLTIRDNGIGIPANQLDKVIKPYYQVDHTKRNRQGVGMGLALVSKIIEDLKGEIKIESTERKGTTISVYLPVVVNGSLVPQEVSPGESNSLAQLNRKFYLRHKEIRATDHMDRPNAPTILLVEDNEALLRVISEAIATNYNVMVARNGFQGLDRFRDNPIDLIISDVMMDELDGIEFLKRLRQVKELRHIPLLFMSARSTLQDRLTGLSLGAVNYIEKPFSLEELLFQVDSLVKNQIEQREALFTVANDALRNKSLVQLAGINTKKTNGATITSQVQDNKDLVQFDFTRRELEIVTAIKSNQHITDKELADSLNLAHRTITTHLSKIYKKAQVSSRVELLEKL